MVTFLFWASFLVIFYTYIGYAMLLWGLVQLKKMFFKAIPYQKIAENDLPSLSIVIAAYNEVDFITQKIENTLALNYPKNKLEYIFVTDGSTDETPEIVARYSEIRLFHSSERKGKMAAIQRVMPDVKNEIVVFTDANTLLNKNALRNIVRHYQNEKIGAVAGEKRIQVADADDASSAGEGFYWRYESKLKTWDFDLYSVVGAAGELFSVRRKLYEDVPHDTIIEDFYMTLKIAQKGYRVAYEPQAFAIETASASVKEELKRKVRIAAGGLQAIFRLRDLLNPFKYGVLSFQYVSHRVLRWTIAPLMLPLFLLCNLILAQTSTFYQFVLTFHLLFYFMAFIGFLLKNKELKIKIFFIPYYFCIMNYAVYSGFLRITKNKQSAIWEKAERKIS
ncbi:MAG: glycosyltransferase family 2 protein [Chitinophagales bacterium]